MRNAISHIKYINNRWEIQTNEEHQNGVAQLAATFADEFGMAEWGRVLGLLHDKGKEQLTFQQHIKKESGYYPNAKVEGDYNHAYVGALMAKQLYSRPPYYQLMDNILMGHHRGLYDDVDKREILKKDIPSDVSIEHIETNLKMPQLGNSKDLHHLVRMLYSCLVDADYLDTERFMQPEQSRLRGGKDSIECLLSRLDKYLNELKLNSIDSEVLKLPYHQSSVQNYAKTLYYDSFQGLVLEWE